MADSVKAKIFARILAICKTLQTQGVVRKVERKHALFMLEPVKPALHIITADEKMLYEDERGYNCQLPVSFQIMFDSNRDPEDQSDKFEAFLQKNIEADEQLGGLCSKIQYNSATPFVVEDEKPYCLTVVTYLLEYRRMRGGPDVGY